MSCHRRSTAWQPGAMLLVCGLGITWLPSTLRAQAAQDSQPSFSEIVRQAVEARDAGQLEKAVELYERTVRTRPIWDEGWWYLGTLQYELNHYTEAASAFERLLELKPDVAPAWALLGLCEFQLERYDAATRHIAKARSLGALGNVEIRIVAEYHWALLLVRAGQFELAAEAMMLLARTHEHDTLELDELAGLIALRMPMLPAQVPEEKRDLVRTAGRAAFANFKMDSREAPARYAELVARYPDVPNVHYAYGIFLLQQQDWRRALGEFRRELEVQPDSIHARLAIAFEYLEQGVFEEALPEAEEAARLAPDLFAARNAYGRALLGLGRAEEAIEELEAAVRLAPESAEMHFSLARAYGRAGRREDAARAREAFRKLDEERRSKVPVLMKQGPAAGPE